MKGRVVVLETFGERTAAARVTDGRLDDFLADPATYKQPMPGAIYRAIAGRLMKGQGGLILELGDGSKGFLRNAKGIAPGTPLLVQVSSQPGEGKAAPVTTRLLFKGRYAIVTPGAAGRNIARSIDDEEERVRLAEIAHDMMADFPDSTGLIMRSACIHASDDEIAEEITSLAELCASVLDDGQSQTPELLVNAPSAAALAWRDWTDPVPDQVFEGTGSFDDHGIWEMLEQIANTHIPLGAQASMFVEPTRALVAVDVNTGGDFSPAAGLKANIAAATQLPRQLRLRGLAGQIVIDFAPMAKKDRPRLEQTLKRALRSDGIDTLIVGWTPLGLLELQRKRARLPLSLQVAGFPT